MVRSLISWPHRRPLIVLTAITIKRTERCPPTVVIQAELLSRIDPVPFLRTCPPIV